MIFSFQTVQFSPRFGADVPLENVIAAASSGGFTSVGLDIWSVDRYIDEGHSIGEMVALLERAELRCTDVLPLVVGSDRAKTMTSAVRLAAIATATGARVCGTALDFDIDDPKEPEVRDQLGRCADSLSAVGVRLAIEFLPYSCVATVSDAWELCDAVGWDAAGLLVDSWHTSVSGQVGSVHGLAAEDIAMVQYSDGVLPSPRNVQDGSRNHRRMPGCGQFDLDGFVAAIVRTGYDGIISPEVLSADVRVAHPDIFAAELRRALRQHWESPPRAVP